MRFKKCATCVGNRDMRQPTGVRFGASPPDSIRNSCHQINDINDGSSGSRCRQRLRRVGGRRNLAVCLATLVFSLMFTKCYSSQERLVERIFMQVSVARREAEMNLDNKDFDDRQQNYRRMRWMQQGLDPDEMEAKWCEEKETRAEARRERLKQENAERRRREEELKNSALVANDKRFQAAVTDRKFKKQKFIASDKLNELVVQRKTTPAAGKKVTKKKGPKSRPQ